MADSPILKIPLVSPTQNDKSTTVNDGLEALEQAMHAPYKNATADGADITISEDDMTRHAVFFFTAATGDKAVKFPSQINSINTSMRFFVFNNTSHALTIKATSGSGSTSVIAPGKVAFLYQDHEDIIQLSIFDTASGAGPVDFSVFWAGVTADNNNIVKYKVLRPFSFADDFVGSLGAVGINPTSSAVFNVNKNGTTIGTVTINTSGGFTFATSGSGRETFAVGDLLAIAVNGTADVTLADISISILGQRT